ncbi:Abscisic acid receptor pyr1 [Thalictrum thalictroides]|uniref:Abscisic acid receptor pyr1 n=1 Tax=Thalictrum thalictroides TaxID=46969 RepID=A0A7J6XAC5_THATH|nr:Abscisic acid receptor pyr1 [Thalictrum thalictroides]
MVMSKCDNNVPSPTKCNAALVQHINAPVSVVFQHPAETSIERLDMLDDNWHVLSFSIIGGDHCLSIYRSVMIHQQKINEPEKTVAVEWFTVDVPSGCTAEDCLYFIHNVIKWKLESLALVSERKASTSLG